MTQFGPPVARLVIGFVLILSGIASCGEAPAVESSGDPETGLPEGRWTVDRLELEGRPVDLSAAAVRVEMLNVGSSMRVDSGCHRLFGSYTFEPNGNASFTVPGVSTNECSADDQAIEDAFLVVIEEVSSWQGDRQELSLIAPTGLLVLVPGE